MLDERGEMALVPQSSCSSSTSPNKQDDDDHNVSGSTDTSWMKSGVMRAHAVRILPDEDLIASIQRAASAAMASATNCRSAFILSAVGSLKQVSLRMASANRLSEDKKNGGNNNNNNNHDPQHHIQTWQEENLEILSLVGTISNGSQHLHMSVSKSDGTTLGGHVISGTVFTTLELVLGTIDGVAFLRQLDPFTGYNELVVLSDDEE